MMQCWSHHHRGQWSSRQTREIWSLTQWPEPGISALCNPSGETGCLQLLRTAHGLKGRPRQEAFFFCGKHWDLRCFSIPSQEKIRLFQIRTFKDSEPEYLNSLRASMLAPGSHCLQPGTPGGPSEMLCSGWHAPTCLYKQEPLPLLSRVSAMTLAYTVYNWTVSVPAIIRLKALMDRGRQRLNGGWGQNRADCMHPFCDGNRDQEHTGKQEHLSLLPWSILA